MKDFYRILGVRQNATLAEIKRAYREKVKMFHPDAAGESSYQSEFTEVVQAYRVLSDARQRNIFDESFFARIKKTYSDSDSFDYYKWLSERKDDESRAKFIFYTLAQYTIDCAKRSYKIGVMDSYGKQDNFITGDYNKYAEFQPIVGGTAVSNVYKKLCRPVD